MFLYDMFDFIEIWNYFELCSFKSLEDDGNSLE